MKYKKIISLLLLIFLICFSSATYLQQSYHIHATYSEGRVNISSIKLVEGFPEKMLSIDEENYKIKIISFGGEVYRDYPFNFPREISITPDERCFIEEGIVDPDLCGGPTHYLSNFSSVLLKIPFSPGARSLELVDPSGRLILKEDLSKFSCGDSICEEHETYSSCRQDCRIKNSDYFNIEIVIAAMIILSISIRFYLKKKK